MTRKHGTTKRAIRRLIEFDPTVTNALIGKTLGISRALVSYHTQSMIIHRETAQKQCIGCHKRVRRENKHQMCRACWLTSYSYEFVCAQCGQVRAVQGREASYRRANLARDESKKDFCDRHCANKHTARKYWEQRRLDPRIAGKV